MAEEAWEAGFEAGDAGGVLFGSSGGHEVLVHRRVKAKKAMLPNSSKGLAQHHAASPVLVFK